MEHGPVKVGDDYTCIGNRNLTSLKHTPKKLSGLFNASGCPLTSLKDGPLEIDGVYIFVSSRKDPVTLLPEEVEWARKNIKAERLLLTDNEYDAWVRPWIKPE